MKNTKQMTSCVFMCVFTIMVKKPQNLDKVNCPVEKGRLFPHWRAINML